MPELKNMARFKRYLIQDKDLLMVRGSIAPVMAGMHEYNSRHGIPLPPEELTPLIQELLATTALAAVSLAERESWGWSLTFNGMDIGFFVGIEPEGMICVNVLAAPPQRASVMIQKQKAGLPLTQSHISPRSRTPRDLVQQYFAEVDQTRSRLEVMESGEGILAHALPGGNFDAIRGLNRDMLFSYFDSALSTGRVSELGEVLLFYECRCSESMILRMFDNITEAEREDLFGDLQSVEVECPRCGRRYRVERRDSTIH